MTFENALVSEQEHLSTIQRRQRMHSQMRNNIRNVFRQPEGDDSE
jgi:hypothetical protein